MVVYLLHKTLKKLRENGEARNNCVNYCVNYLFRANSLQNLREIAGSRNSKGKKDVFKKRA